MQYCPKCGTKLTEGTKFCANCGYDLSKETVKDSATSSNQAQQTKPENKPDKKQEKKTVDETLWKKDHERPVTTRDIDWSHLTKAEKRQQNKETFWWQLLAVAFPIVGFVCYFVWRNSKAVRAHKMVWSAWGGVLCNILYLLFNH